MNGDIKREGYLEEHHRYFHLKDTAGQELDFHFHEFNKIVILISGRVDYAVENELCPLNPGDILLVRHHTIHRANIDRTVPYERIIIYLNESYFASAVRDTNLTVCFEAADREGRRLITPDEDRREEILNLCKNYERYSGANKHMSIASGYALNSESARSAIRELLICQLLILLGDSVMRIDSAVSRHRGGLPEEILSKINENLSGELSVNSLAASVFMSRSHFMRLFHEATGTTVHAYIRQRRLLNAARLIREGTASAEAAKISGFEDYSSFYRAFVKMFGISPSAIKNS